MKQIDNIKVAELTKLAASKYGEMIKGVVDIAKSILVVDVEMHVDAEQYLLEQGSNQADLWGINLYPGKFGTSEFIKFDSMINIRPSQQNRSRGVENLQTRAVIQKLIDTIVK